MKNKTNLQKLLNKKKQAKINKNKRILNKIK